MWPWVVGGVGGLLLVALVAGGIVAAVFLSEAKTAQRALEKAKYELSTMGELFRAGDEAAIQRTADEVTALVAEASGIVEGPLWHMAARVPFVGHNVDAVQRVTRAVDILVDRALPPGLHIMSTMDLGGITLEGGGINLEPFRQAEASLPDITAAFADAQVEIAPIDKDELVSEITGPIDEVLSIIEDAGPALELVDEYLPTLLDMAGSGGSKTYLVIFQNNAEIRATGGNPAASMILTVTDGKLGFVDQASSKTFVDLGTAGQVYTWLPDETTGFYLSGFQRYSQDYTMTPDFPTTAQLFQDLWLNTSGAYFDGVISIDPVVLSHMLAVAGPVTLASGEQVTAENAVSLLLSQSYEHLPDGAASDAFFADVAQRVFTHLTSASWDPMEMIKALEQSVKEQRVYLAFVDPRAQELAVELGVDGALRPDTVEQTQVGVYLNNSSVSKLEYHLTTWLAASCDPAARTMTTTLTMYNGITNDIHSEYTLGYRNIGRGLPRTTMMLDVMFFAPPGAQIVSVDPAAGRVPEWDRWGLEKGNSAVSRTVFVGQDETVTASATVAFPAGDLGPLNLRYSPTANATEVTVDASCDALFGTPDA